jgi:hypothetical protein
MDKEGLLLIVLQIVTLILSLFTLFSKESKSVEPSDKKSQVRRPANLIRLLLTTLFTLLSILLIYVHQTKAAKDRSDAKIAAAKSDGKIDALRDALKDNQKVYIAEVQKLRPTEKTAKQVLIGETEQYRDQVIAYMNEREQSFPPMTEAERSSPQSSMEFEGRAMRFKRDIVKQFRESPYYRDCLRITVELDKHGIPTYCNVDDTSSPEMIKETAKKLVVLAKSIPDR